jgi:hypothetical protein
MKPMATNTRRRDKPARYDAKAWLPIIILPAIVLASTPGSVPRWIFMWLIAAALFASLKWLTWYTTRVPNAPLWRQLGYLLAWPGMDARAFLDSTNVPRSPTVAEWSSAAINTTIGIALFFGIARYLPIDRPILIAWTGMIAIVLTLHFGTFQLLSCVWRQIGVDAKPLMNWPIRSTSLSEFWGRRWNIPFRDLTYRFLFKPLSLRFGGAPALVIGFLVSGLIHELAITIPAKGGYGGPTIFFLLQAAGLIFERSSIGKQLGLGKSLQGWCFTAAMLLCPAPLLFPKPFLHVVIIPMMQDLHAINS